MPQAYTYLFHRSLSITYRYENLRKIQNFIFPPKIRGVARNFHEVRANFKINPTLSPRKFLRFHFFSFNMVRLSPFFDFGLALQAAVNTAFAGGKIRELKQTNLEDVKGKWRSRAIAPVIPTSSTLSSCFPIWRWQEKRPAGICAFMLLFCLIKISFTLYFAFTLPLSVLFPDPLTASPWPPFWI